MSKQVAPKDVMIFLNQLFSIIDLLVDKHGVHKVGAERGGQLVHA